ncbi:Embryogenesis-associated protein EMB8 [Dichanthelium oligosanthes]|uniref:Embryogenesis-associated protein EMB8 n=1 Tax=Dichanthelium oligosanthes TaxID=888268 RepID=A0A1E5VV67_9POAL|nr:Embryogenesis-associated protein EMB8 [Dichanthelium oligosanthes]
MEAASSSDAESAGELLLRAAALVPWTRYALAALALAAALLYRFLELHFLGDLLRGFHGGRVALTFHPESQVYHRVASKCRSLHGRYLATPWLASPHLQTLFLSISGRSPSFTYRRQLYTVRDGGTIALDWLLASDLEAADVGSYDESISKDDSTPLLVVIPGLTSDSSAAYVKHLVFSMASKGWNVVVSNHRGLGGISITSDCFYNAGWTEDMREIVNFLHQKYPEAPLFTVGTSIGANIVVKYLGEEGESTPVAGAASICSPWDLLVTNRFISRKLVQRCYDRALAIGLKGYAKLHQSVLARLANWEAITSAQEHGLHSSLETTIDKSPYVNFMEDGMVAAVTNDGPDNNDSLHNQIVGEIELNDGMVAAQQNEYTREIQNENDSGVGDKNSSEGNVTFVQGHEGYHEQREKPYANNIHDAIAPIRRSINQITQSQGKSVWLLAYIAVVTSWPFLGALGFFLFRKRFSNSLLAKKLKKL